MLRKRVYSFMEELNNINCDTIVIVTHAHPSTLIVFWWLGLQEESKISFEFGNCNITELTINEWGEKTIVRLNDMAHL
jgi:probable phosphoglycerate mutase